MTAASFYILFRLLEPFLEGPPHPRNGPKGGISHSEVFNSVWKIVDAVNLCDELAFKYPASHEEQKKIAEGFLAKSYPGFTWCAGAIDCMLVWIEKPTETQCVEASVGRKKWFCGRKKKFGIALQGTCDVEGRFLDVVMEHPAWTSDFLAFTTCPLYHKLEVQGFLAEGLCFFGDKAYVNCRYMATPYRGATVGTSEDNYNFFHSQLRIRIECAFGMLVGRWGVLRKAIPATVGLRKITAMVMCLCRLHNFLINRRIEERGPSVVRPLGRPGEDLERVDNPLSGDELDIAANGGVPLEENGTPVQLLDGGYHHDDTTAAYRKQFSRRGLSGEFPREIMRDVVLNGGNRRPLPARWLNGQK